MARTLNFTVTRTLAAAGLLAAIGAHAAAPTPKPAAATSARRRAR